MVKKHLSLLVRGIQKFGGNVNMDMNGKLLFMQEQKVQDVQYVLIKKL